MKKALKKKIGTMCLVIATFLNPFGYDLLVFKLTQLTGDYWTTMHILYFAAALFFILFLIFYKINPVYEITHRVKKINTLIKNRKR